MSVNWGGFEAFDGEALKQGYLLLFFWGSPRCTRHAREGLVLPSLTDEVVSSYVSRTLVKDHPVK